MLFLGTHLYFKNSLYFILLDFSHKEFLPPITELKKKKNNFTFSTKGGRNNFRFSVPDITGCSVVSVFNNLWTLKRDVTNALVARKKKNTEVEKGIALNIAIKHTLLFQFSILFFFF